MKRRPRLAVVIPLAPPHAGQRYRVVELAAGALEDWDGAAEVGPEGAPERGPGHEDGGPGSEIGARPTEKIDSGAQKQACYHEDRAKCPGCPSPQGVEGGYVDSARSLSQIGESADPKQRGCPNGNTGATGAQEEEDRKKDNNYKSTSSAPAPTAELGHAGAHRGAPGHGPFDMVTDAAHLPAPAAAVESAGIVGLDIETVGLDPVNGRPRRPRPGRRRRQGEPTMSFVVQLLRRGLPEERAPFEFSLVEARARGDLLAIAAAQRALDALDVASYREVGVFTSLEEAQAEAKRLRGRGSHDVSSVRVVDAHGHAIARDGTRRPLAVFMRGSSGTQKQKKQQLEDTDHE